MDEAFIDQRKSFQTCHIFDYVLANHVTYCKVSPQTSNTQLSSDRGSTEKGHLASMRTAPAVLQQSALLGGQKPSHEYVCAADTMYSTPTFQKKLYSTFSICFAL